MPLRSGERAVGVATLGGSQHRRVRDGEAATLLRLAGQAAIGAGRGGRARAAQLALAGQCGGAGRRARGDRAGRARPRAGLRQRGDGGARGAAVDADRRGDRRRRGDLRRLDDPEAYFATGRRCWPTPTSRPRTSWRSPGWCWSATRRRSTTRRARGSAAWSCCATSPASARPTSSSPTSWRPSRTSCARRWRRSWATRSCCARGGWTPAAREEILGTVHREAKRLSALIDDFLDVQTIEQDRLVIDAGAVLGRRAAGGAGADVRRAERGARAAPDAVRGARDRRSATGHGSRRSSRTCCPTRSSTRRTAVSVGSTQRALQAA